MDAFPRAIAGAIVAAFCVAGVANAKDDPSGPPELAGRWVAQSRKLVIDIARCGNGWCGVEVTDGKSCGKTVLRVELSGSDTEEPALRGRLELASETRPYAVQVSYFEPPGGGPVDLFVNGHTGSKFEPWRRNYPFREMLVSTGPAQCPTDPKVS
jgi:hypothetical protein